MADSGQLESGIDRWKAFNIGMIAVGLVCLLYPVVWKHLLNQPSAWYYTYTWAGVTALWFLTAMVSYELQKRGEPNAA